MYIYNTENWPHFVWDSSDKAFLTLLGNVRNLQGKLIGKMEMLGFELQQEATLENLTLDVLKSTEIEGEYLSLDQVRSSIARHLGMDISGLVPSDRNTDGIVQMTLDATLGYEQPLTQERLFNWHAALFPTGRSGMFPIAVGAFRTDETGPMQVVSGPMGREKVHFEAPAARRLPQEINLFLDWFNQEQLIDPVIKAAIAHLWFLTLHPFDDGNGRIGRAIADMQLARADGVNRRFYSMSAQIKLKRKQYYEILEDTQKGDLDISDWLFWFLNCLRDALAATDVILEKVLAKAKYWDTHRNTPINERQRLLLNKLLDGFDGKLTSSKWAKIAKCSPDTALRDMQDLIQKKMLHKEEAGGRSTGYLLTN